MVMRMMAALVVAGSLLCGTAAAEAVDHYDAAALAQTADALKAKAAATGSAAETLARYSNHHMMLSYRAKDGNAELHTHYADVFVIVRGKALLLIDGTIPDGKEESPGEIRGPAVKDGKPVLLATGDVVHIPAGVPHQMLIAKGDELVYFVVKIKEKE
jgi:mannose-6-phosphate isomerase-like protein (cupin superfamily)